jgi:hypothetical protein
MHDNAVTKLGMSGTGSAAILTELGMSLSMVRETLTEVRVHLPQSGKL